MKFRDRTLSTVAYLLIAALLFLAVGGAVSAVNYFVDPYGIFFPPETSGLSSRPAIAGHERLHKQYAVKRARARTLLLGNSRVLLGFNPRNPLLIQPAYNAAFSNGTPYEKWKTLQYALEAQPPALVLVDMGPYDLFISALTRPGFGASSLAVDLPLVMRLCASLQDLMAAFSHFALRDSLSTLFAQGLPAVRYAGGTRDSSLMESFNQAANRQRKSIYITQSIDLHKLATNPVPGQVEALKGIIQECARHHARLVIFFNPIHARLLDQAFDDEVILHKQLEAIRQALADSTRTVELWTFLGFNEITMEPILKPGPMRYYWEISHYREIVGDMMMARMLGSPKDAADLPENFGYRIDYTDPGWTDREMQRLRDERVIWKQRLKSDPELYLP